MEKENKKELKKPIVYIILPVFNWEKYFLEQLISIYNQNYKNRFLIIVNDWSTDWSECIANQFIKNYWLENKAKIINKNNWWVNSAIETGLKEILTMNSSNNNYVSFCDADDQWMRNKLEVQVDFMIKNKNCDLSYHDLVIVDENNNFMSKSIIKNSSNPMWNPYSNSFIQSALFSHLTSTELMFKARDINTILPMPSWYRMYQDYWVNIVYSLLWKNIMFIDKSLWFYRKWHTSLSSLEKWQVLNNFKSFYLQFEFLEKKYPYDKVKYMKNYYYDRRKWLSTNNSLIKTLFLILVNYPRIFFHILCNIIIYPINRLRWFL